MKSKNYTYFSERSYTGKDCKIDDKVVDYWKKVLGDNVFNNIEKVYNLRPEIVMSKKDFENVTESKEILQFSELFQTGFGENVKYQLKIGEKGAFVFDRFLDHFIKFGIAVLNEQEIDECIMDSYIDNIIRQISKISMGTLSKRRKVYIVTEKETFEFYGKLNEIEESLRASKGIFLRIHQSFLINYKHIKGLAYDFAVMDNEERLSISEDRRKLISEQYCAMEDTFYVGM